MVPYSKPAVEIGFAETFLAETPKIFHRFAHAMRFSNHFGFRPDSGDGEVVA